MPRRCAICDHPLRTEIDASITANNLSFARIAAQHAVSSGSIRRHAATHLIDAMAAAQTAQAGEIVAAGGTLLEQVHTLQAQAAGILRRAEGAGDLRTALAAIRELRGCLELLGKLEGQIQERSTVNVLIAPDWSRLRSLILSALSAFPEARIAVAGALAETGNG